MTRHGHAGLYDALFAQACGYAELLGRIRGWLDATTPDPRHPYLAPISARQALREIRRLVDQYDAEQTATAKGGVRS